MEEIKKNKFQGFDRIFPLIGGHHLYQWLLLGVVGLQGCFFCFHHVGYIFLAAVPPHWCEIDELKTTNWTIEQIKNISIPRISNNKFEKCEQYDLNYTQLAMAENFTQAYENINFSQVQRKPCTKWTYDQSIYHSTTATEFNLVCGRKYLVATIQATYMMGVFVGSFMMGGLSDMVLGRRNTVLVSVILAILCGFGAAFSTSYMTFIIFRFFIAIGVTGSFQNCFIIMMEYSDTSYRALMGMMQSIPFAFGIMIMPIYAYFIRDWSNLQLAFTITTLTLLSYFWTLPKSSRWLATQGRENEAMKILSRISKRNKMPELNRMEIRVILKECRDESNGKSDTNFKKNSYFVRICGGLTNFFGNYLNLLRTPELRKRSIILWILYISVTLVYYGVSFDSALLTDDPFLLIFLLGLMEIPGCFVVTPFVSRWGRRPTVATTFLLSGASFILIAVTPSEVSMLRIIFSMTGKLFISGCAGVIYILGTELYPTSTRATGLGSAVIMGRVGSILAPYVVNQTKSIYSDMPSIIFGVTGIFAGLLANLLPESKDTEMLESIVAIESIANTKELNGPGGKLLPPKSPSFISADHENENTVV